MRLRKTTEQPDQVEAAAERSRQREGLLEQQRLNEAMRSNKPELERSRLTFGRHGEVTHDDGRQYRLVRGEIVGAAEFSAFDAWYLDPFGRAEFLQADPTR